MLARVFTLMGLVCLLACNCEVVQDNQDNGTVLIPTAPTIDLKDMSMGDELRYVLAAREPMPYTVFVKLFTEIHRGSSMNVNSSTVKVRKETGYHFSGMSKRHLREENITKIVVRIEVEFTSWAYNVGKDELTFKL